jgi:DNA-directed RNA polymerase subunit RPC12/RpoP
MSTARDASQRLVPDAPYVCRVCSSELVQPREWSDAGDQRWQVELRCPDCGWNGHGVFDGTQLAELEERLDLGFAELVRDLKRLRSANMTEEIERFATALEAGLILPEDF